MSNSWNSHRSAGLGIGAVALAMILAAGLYGAGTEETPKFTFDSNGDLLLPSVQYREWVYVGTPLTPNTLNPPEAPFPDFHSVYIHPADFAHYRDTGTFQDGTVLVKELVSVGATDAVSGKGYFMGEFTGLEATIKDSKRFPEEPGNWAYFSFGHSYPLAKKATALPTGACASCHLASAADDMVFTQYYPVLRAVKTAEPPPVSPDPGGKIRSMAAAMGEAPKTGPMAGADLGAVKVPLDSDSLFKWLQAESYKSWASESAIHPSTGPHDDVLTFLNPALDNSLKNKSTSHPPGATSVKELYKDDVQYGWAVSVKTQKDSDGGQGWYWYEVTSTTDPTQIVRAAQGDGFCAGCHSFGGSDFVKIPYPLK